MLSHQSSKAQEYIISFWTWPSPTHALMENFSIRFDDYKLINKYFILRINDIQSKYLLRFFVFKLLIVRFLIMNRVT